MFDFASNREVATLDDVPTQFHSLYVEKEGGGYHLSQEPAVKAAVEAIVGQSRALKKARDDADEMKKKAVDLAPLAEYGDTPERILETVQAKIEDLRKAGGKKQQDIDSALESLRNELKTAHASEIKAHTDKSSNLEAQLVHAIRSANLTQAIVDEGGDPEIVMPFLERWVDVRPDDNGRYSMIVLDDDGKPRYSGATAEPMTPREKVQELKKVEKFQPFFKSEKPSGGGMPPRQPSAPPRHTPGADKSSHQKILSGLNNPRNLGGREPAVGGGVGV